MCEKNIILDEIGKQYLGPFLAAYCQWIHAQREILKLDEIIFLARDGYAIQKVYKKLYPNENTFYVRLSRKALRMPYIVSCPDFHDYLKIIPPFQKYSIRDFFQSIYCDVNDELKLFPDLDYSVKYKELFSDKTFQKAYEIIRKQNVSIGLDQKKLLLEYLQERGVQEGKRVGLVEHSFKGTSQYMLERIVCQEIPVQFIGLYFYGNAIAEQRLNNRFRSFLDNKMTRCNLRVFEKGILTERLMFECCGSVVGYKKKECVVEPVLERYLEKKNDAIILEIQKNALLYADEITGKYKIIDKRKAICGMLKLLKHPTSKEAKLLGTIEDDNIKENCISLACLKPIRAYLKSPREFVKDIKKSIWRQGFLAQLPLGSVFREIYNFLLYFKYIKE